ncbi:MAG: TolC family protein [Muribaculaceae bacterium]|nr:TolC family protein [Muribaculaceae bacterium]
MSRTHINIKGVIALTGCLSACFYAYATDPVRLPEALHDSVSMSVQSNPEHIQRINTDSLAKGKSIQLKGNNLPSGYGFTAFSSASMPEVEEWWMTFKDPVLNRVEAIVRNNNFNLRAALKRIEASRQMLRQTYSGYYPTISLMAGYDIDRDSGREALPYSDAQTNTYFQLGATVSWEIDIFGRIRQKAKAAKADIEVSRLEYEALQLSLEAEAAIQYADILMYKQQREVALTHLKSQEDILAIAEARYKAGLVSKLDVAQAKSMVSSTRLLVPQYTSRMTSAMNALATLCGVRNTDIQTMLGEAAMPHLTVPLQVGVPADLIRRRPDVAEAEKQIESLADQMGVAKKAYLPSLTLNATLGTSSHEAKRLFGTNSFNYEINPTLTWTLFDGFSREASVAEAKANMEAQIESYNMTLTTALQEVEDAMQNYIASGRELTLYSDVLENSQEVVDLSLERYRHGLTDFTDVANAQITYLQNHTNYQTARATLFSCIVRLYKALGGGFSLNANN